MVQEFHRFTGSSVRADRDPAKIEVVRSGLEQRHPGERQPLLQVRVSLEQAGAGERPGAAHPRLAERVEQQPAHRFRHGVTSRFAFGSKPKALHFSNMAAPIRTRISCLNPSAPLFRDKLLDFNRNRIYILPVMKAFSCSAPKGRPREFCVDAALTAALGVFWAKGYEGASLTDLTEAMGINKPSLYAAFGNKEALFRKALDLYEREKLAYMSEALNAPTARGVAEQLLRGALALQTSNSGPKGCMGVIHTVACGTEAESIRADVIARGDKVHQALVDRLIRAKAEGDLPPQVEPAGLAAYLKALLQGLSVQAGAGATRAQLEQLVQTSLAFWPAPQSAQQTFLMAGTETS